MKKELLESIKQKTSDMNTVRVPGCMTEPAKKLWWRKFSVRLQIEITDKVKNIHRGDCTRVIRECAAQIAEQFDTNVKTRYEWTYMQVYFTSEDHVMPFLELLDKWNERHSRTYAKPLKVHGMDYYPVDLDDVDSQRNIVVCNNLPHKKYRFKVTVKLDEVRTGEQATAFTEYFDRQCKGNEKPFHFPGAWRYAQKRGFWYGPNPYFYVEGEKEMSIVGFYAGHAVHKIDEYRTKNELNID